jgi:branched-chain amino acid transport system substrate-binding protein
MKTQLQQCKDAGCDLVFLPIYAAQAATILGNAKDMDYSPTFLGCDGMDGILSVENFDKSLAEGLIMMTPFAADAEDAATVSFVEKYKAKSGGEIPNQFAADGYDVIYAIYNGCVAKGVNGEMSNADICKALQEYFAAATFNGLTGTNMTWDENGMVSKVPTAVEVVNGAYVKK